ncbi:MAG: DUF4328 domain-containing protein [Actinobacteria bacterium]|nr:DUF4328 domain-containing protein [Actinomycetota bacterium]
MLNAAVAAVDLVSSAFFVGLLTDVRESCQFDLRRRCSLGESRAIYEALDAGDDRQLALGILAIVVLASGVLWLIWQNRCHTRVRRTEVGEQRFGPWSILWWFVPIANLFVPYQAVKELSSVRGPPPLWHLRSWWTALLLSAVGNRILFRMEIKPGDIDDAIGHSYGRIVVDVVDALAAVLAVMVVARIHDRLVADPVPVPRLGTRPAGTTLLREKAAWGAGAAILVAGGSAVVIALAPQLPPSASSADVSDLGRITRSAGPSGSTTYTSEGAAFSITLPRGWTLGNHRKGEVDLLAHLGGVATVLVVAEALPPGMSLSQYATVSRAQVERDPEIESLSQVRTVEIPAGPAALITARGHTGATGIPFVQRFYVLVENGIGYGVVVTTLGDRGPTAEEAEGIMETFQLR